MGTQHRVRASKEVTARLPIFDGFPYLVTRVVRAFRHMALLPTDWTEHELRRLARYQASANRLETCLVFESDRAIHYDLDAEPSSVMEAPQGGLFTSGRLQLPTDFPRTAEFVERTRRLDEYIAAQKYAGYLLGNSDETYRAATPDELLIFAGRDSKGVPRGLGQCTTCGEYRGVCLGTAPAYAECLAVVYCRCENDNVCARCAGPLAEWRLNANYYDPLDGHVWYVPAFCGFKHRCDSSGSANITWWIGSGEIQ